MTMKKRFLGLALAAMVALPATNAYAASQTATVEGNDTETLTHNVTVSGTVRNREGTAPAGKIQVELPTAMAFTVDEASNLTGANYQVSNRSSVPVRLSVAEFRKTTGDITVEETASFSKESKDRSHVTLTLDGRVDDSTTSIDLGGFLKPSGATAETDILDVKASSTGMITLSGEAGTKAVNNSLNSSEADGVDKNGAKGEFSLVFKIKKNA